MLAGTLTHVLTAPGVAPARICVDHGLIGTNRDRPGLRGALAACRAGDTLVITKLDRLARSLPDPGRHVTVEAGAVLAVAYTPPVNAAVVASRLVPPRPAGPSIGSDPPRLRTP